MIDINIAWLLRNQVIKDADEPWLIKCASASVTVCEIPARYAGVGLLHLPAAARVAFKGSTSTCLIRMAIRDFGWGYGTIPLEGRGSGGARFLASKGEKVLLWGVFFCATDQEPLWESPHCHLQV
jgi:hypothetical protein